MNFNEQIEISAKAAEALDRIRSKRNIQSQDNKHQDFSRIVFEEYSESAFIKKIKLDTYIYENLLTECDEQYLPQIQEQLVLYVDSIRSIYEHINIEPKLVGFNKLTLESSENQLNQEGRRIIFEYLDKNYYSLNQAQRSAKYKSQVIHEAKDLVISDNIEIDDSVSHVYKAAILSNLLESVAFPFVIKNTILELLESESYRQIFNAEKLEELWSNYNENLSSISKILSLV